MKRVQTVRGSPVLRTEHGQLNVPVEQEGSRKTGNIPVEAVVMPQNAKAGGRYAAPRQGSVRTRWKVPLH